MKSKTTLMTISVIVLAITGTGNLQAQTGNKIHGQPEIYQAELKPLNTKTTGTKTTGSARFVIINDTMTVTIDVKGAPAGIEHWQHFHGFEEDGKVAGEATMTQDANGDGILDVEETGVVSGTTMVPFNKIPSAMNLGARTYPVADAKGSYHYVAKIPMSELRVAFAKAFNGSAINLDTRVLYIHGVPDKTKLPATVGSVGNVPAQITLPIAVGKIVRVK